MHATLEDTVLVKTARMAAVDVDAGARAARVAAGRAECRCREGSRGARSGRRCSARRRTWAWSASRVGGGLGWLARRYGLACNSVRAAQVVTGAGEIVRADADTEPELFWALRGGGGAFGVVTELEMDLFEVDQVFAGDVMYDAEHAPTVLRAYRDWARQAPRELTSERPAS